MYAIIADGGKQYRAHVGSLLKVEKKDLAPGDVFSLDRVLLVENGQSLRVGAPYVAGVSVSATVVRHGRQKKIRIIKMKRRKHQMKRQGHRQHFTEIHIQAIEG